MTQTAPEHCENCGRPIGRLETPHLIDNHIVCAECRGRIQASQQAPQPPPARPPAPVVFVPPPAQPRPDRSGWWWAGGIGLCLMTFASIRAGFPTVLISPLLLIGGVFLMPPTWRLIARRWPVLAIAPTPIRLLVGLAGFLLLIRLIPHHDTSPSTYYSGGGGGYSASSPSYTPSSPAAHPWYVGGTLHKATMAEWRRASYENRLATSADMVMATAHSRGISFTSADEAKPQAVALEQAVTTAGEGGNADNQKVSEIAAACLLLMDKDK